MPTLASLDGRRVDLAALLGDGPLVLVFHRGGWCPYCNVTLRAYRLSLASIRDVGASLVVVTPELPQHAEATASKNDVDFDILLDPENRFAAALGLVFTLPDYLRRR